MQGMSRTARDSQGPLPSPEKHHGNLPGTTGQSGLGSAPRTVKEQGVHLGTLQPQALLSITE